MGGQYLYKIQAHYLTYRFFCATKIFENSVSYCSIREILSSVFVNFSLNLFMFSIYHRPFLSIQ